jgi:hypothetical protein
MAETLVWLRPGSSFAKTPEGPGSPDPLLLNNVSLATIRVVIEMHSGNLSGAVEQSRPAAPYEFADGGSIPTGYGVYCSGLAHLGLRLGKGAAEEFLKLLDNRG